MIEHSGKDILLTTWTNKSQPSSLPSRARSLSTLPACKAPGNAMKSHENILVIVTHAIMKSASIIAQPKFHNKKIIQVWKHQKVSPPKKKHTTTPPHRTRVPRRSVAFRTFPKKTHGFDVRDVNPRPPELRQSTSATNLEPGPKKHQKVGFWGTKILDDYRWMLKGKRLDFVGLPFFWRMIFVVKDDLLKTTCLWRNLDPFGCVFVWKRLGFLDFSGR